MRKILFWCVVLVAMSLVAMPTLAQVELAEMYDDGTVSFYYPEGFDIDDSGSEIIVTDGTITIALDGPVGRLFGDNPAEALDFLLTSRGLTHSDIEVIEFPVSGGTREVAVTVLDDGRWAMAVAFDDGGFGLVVAEGVGAGTEQITVVAIAATFNDSGASPMIATGGGGVCTVSVDTDDTARLRVGPGTNRTSVAFLPSRQEFEVLGRATDDAGAVWYQLDKDQAAPTRAVNEVWVAAADVNSRGNCDTVGEASAPPIIPIGAGGGQSGGGGGQAGGGAGTVTLVIYTVSYCPAAIIHSFIETSTGDAYSFEAPIQPGPTTFNIPYGTYNFNAGCGNLVSVRNYVITFNENSPNPYTIDWNSGHGLP